MYQEFATILGAIITGAATITSVWFAHSYVKRTLNTHRNPVADDAAQSANVYTALQHTLAEMGGDRAYVLEFHNGGHYYSGRGQQNFSCTHEIAVEGITRECDSSQDHRVSNYHTYISELIELKKFAYSNIEDATDKAFASVLSGAGVKSIYNVPIKTLNGKIIGILGVDYVRSPVQNNVIGFDSAKSEGFSDKAADLMKSQARVIAGYLI